jgi:hypothetical protein
MPRINHYEAEVTVRFVIDGPLSPADAATAAEDRASKALLAEADEGTVIQSAHITALSVRDVR